MTDKLGYRSRVPCYIYSRVVGYYSPLQMVEDENGEKIPGKNNTWNLGKFEEFKERKMYKLNWE